MQMNRCYLYKDMWMKYIINTSKKHMEYTINLNRMQVQLPSAVKSYIIIHSKINYTSEHLKDTGSRKSYSMLSDEIAWR